MNSRGNPCRGGMSSRFDAIVGEARPREVAMDIAYFGLLILLFGLTLGLVALCERL